MRRRVSVHGRSLLRPGAHLCGSTLASFFRGFGFWESSPNQNHVAGLTQKVPQLNRGFGNLEGSDGVSWRCWSGPFRTEPN